MKHHKLRLPSEVKSRGIVAGDGTTTMKPDVFLKNIESSSARDRTIVYINSGVVNQG
jgi:hypothetical protein